MRLLTFSTEIKDLQNKLEDDRVCRFSFLGQNFAQQARKCFNLFKVSLQQTGFAANGTVIFFNAP